MNDRRYDLAAPPRTLPREEPPIPAILMISVVHGGQECSLALFRTHFHDEGTCLVERLSDPRTTDLVVNGVWRINTVDDGARVLSVEVDDPGVDDWAALLNELLHALSELPAFWADAYEEVA